MSAWVPGQVPEVRVGTAPVGMSGQLVPVTVWVRPDVPVPAPVVPGTAPVYGKSHRPPYALMGLAVGVVVVAALGVSLVIALVAVVVWVSAHALVVGVGITAVALSGLLFLRAMAPRGCGVRGCGWGV